MKKIILETAGFQIEAELNDSYTAQVIYDALPFFSSVNRWGEEIYFTIPVHVEQEPDAKEEVEIGDLGFWPVGDAFCIFFGRTPVSRNEKPRAYSPVNIFGHIRGDTSSLKMIQAGTKIRVTKQMAKI
jgi:hypothetical protein